MLTGTCGWKDWGTGRNGAAEGLLDCALEQWLLEQWG